MEYERNTGLGATRVSGSISGATNAIAAREGALEDHLQQYAGLIDGLVNMAARVKHVGDRLHGNAEQGQQATDAPTPIRPLLEVLRQNNSSLTQAMADLNIYIGRLEAAL